MKKVLEKLRIAKLLLKLEKCEFYRKELKFLGYIVGRHRIRIDLAKVEAVLL